MSYHHLTMDERNVIYRMRFQGYSKAAIARCLGCHRGTVGRECQRNAQSDGRYEPGAAQPWPNSRRRAHLRRTKTGQDRLMAYVGDRDQRGIVALTQLAEAVKIARPGILSRRR